MARTKKDRSIQLAPSLTSFTPKGGNCDNTEIVVLYFEEYESIKLCDYHLLSHLEAATLMKISRPTFTRIYEKARRKIAKSFVEACTIEIEAGTAIANVRWYNCKACSIQFTILEHEIEICPLCKLKP